MKEIVKLAIAGVITVAFVIFLAFFAIYEDNLAGKGQQNQNISGATGSMVLCFIENTIHQQGAVDMVNIALTNENILKLNN
ncbi:MAG TPA: hypothetical protein VHO92_03360 [Methanobacterium sp.]|nr:hypothetical protein [Methanobacterium sp.]